MTAASTAIHFGTPERERSLRPIPVAALLSSPQAALLWLVRLRWHALVALAVAMTLAPWLMGVSVAWLPALALVGGLALSNLGCRVWARSRRRVPAAALGALLLADTLLLTGALALSGGALNPCVTLYVIEVTLAALLSSAAWVFSVGALSLAGYALLLASPHAAVARPGNSGSLVALALTLTLNAILVVRTARAFRQRQAELALAQQEAARSEKLASLTTLAAGAAHELATPLGTIAVAATELELLIETEPQQALLEARLIREQVSRCKHILQRLGARAGSEPGELPQRTTAAGVFAHVRAELGARATRLDTIGDDALELETTLESLTAVLTNLVSNGLQASAPQARVTLELSAPPQLLRCTVVDRGSGIDALLLPRLGEPFLTTKEPGEGLGLGLFLAFRFARSQGGRLHIDSAPGLGTRVQLDLPRTGRAGS